jgi:hypothetical protein
MGMARLADAPLARLPPPRPVHGAWRCPSSSSRGFCVVSYAFVVGESKILPFQLLLFTRGKVLFAFRFCIPLLGLA